MKCTKEMMLVYAVSDSSMNKHMPFLNVVEEVLRNGATMFQLREKHLDEEDFVKEALEVQKLCQKYHVPLIINDNVSVAMRIGADGVHVGQDDMDVKEVRRLVGEEMIIGTSCHNRQEALQAEQDGADYLGCGAVFVTSTKNDVTPLSKETLVDITANVHIPVVAIGGIQEDNIMQLAGSGVDGVAVVSALFASDDPAEATKRIRKLVLEMKGEEK